MKKKHVPIARLVQKPSLFMTKMAKIDTLPVFMTKTAEKPYPLGRTYHKIPNLSLWLYFFKGPF